MDISINGFSVKGLNSGAPININITIGGSATADSDDEPVNLSTDDFQAPVERPANINDTTDDILAEQNDRFVEQFASDLADHPVYGDAIVESQKDVNTKSDGDDQESK